MNKPISSAGSRCHLFLLLGSSPKARGRWYDSEGFLLDRSGAARKKWEKAMKTLLLLGGVALLVYYFYASGEFEAEKASEMEVALSPAVTVEPVAVTASEPAGVDREFKSIVRHMYEEWRHRNASTGRTQYGVRRDLSISLSKIKLRGPHLESTIERQIALALSELGVRADEVNAVASGILAEAKRDGERKGRSDVGVAVELAQP
jgi:hypothetical protein